MSRYSLSDMDAETIGVIAELRRLAQNRPRVTSRRGKLDAYRRVLHDASDRLTQFLKARPDTGL